MRSIRPGLALLALACQDAPLDEPPALEGVDLSTAESVTTQPSWGAAPLTVVLRSVNAVGARTPAEDAVVEVDGEPVTLDLSDGEARVVLEAPGLHTIGIGTLDHAMWVADGTAPALSLPLAAPPDPDTREALAFEGGVLEVHGASVRRRDPAAPERATEVLAVAAEGVMSTRVVDVDRDGAEDLVAAERDQILILRGDGEGDLRWGAALAACGPLDAVGIGHLDADGVPDLAFATDEGEGPVLIALLGDGAFGFDEAARVPLSASGAELAVLWDEATGEGSVGILQLGGGWERYALRDGLLTAVEAAAPAAWSDDVVFLPPVQLDEDGGDELVVAFPRREGEDRPIHVVDFETRPPTVLARHPRGGHVALGDADGVGPVEVWLAEEPSTLRLLTDVEGELSAWALFGRYPFGPLAPGRFADTEGPFADLWVARPSGAHRLRGGDGPSAPWAGARTPRDNLLDGIRRVFLVEDGDEATVFVGVQARDGETTLERWRKPDATAATLLVESHRLAGGEDAYQDAARCGDDLVVATATGLARALLPEVTPVAASDLSGVRRVACRATADGLVVAALVGDDVVWLDEALVEQDRASAPGARGLVLTGGDAEAVALHTCAETGCAVGVWEDTPDGRPITATDEGWFSGDARVGPPRLLGVPRRLDTPDGARLFARDGDTLAALGDADGQPVPIARWALPGAAAAVQFLADGDGDGLLDIFAVDAEGQLFVTVVPP